MIWIDTMGIGSALWTGTLPADGAAFAAFLVIGLLVSAAAILLSASRPVGRPLRPLHLNGPVAAH